MTLGFYYHIAVDPRPDGVCLPGYLGVFLEALAAEVDRLLVFAHTAPADERPRCDYALRGANIEFIDMGPKSPAWQRFLWPSRSLTPLREHVARCDWLMVRAPSPLAPAFPHAFRDISRVCYLVVGDYIEGVKYLQMPRLRRWAVATLSLRNDRQLTNVLPQCLTLVNSSGLREKYEGTVPDLHEVRTTTLSVRDMHPRADTCEHEVRLLYTGRIDVAKGLRELVEATALLQDLTLPVSLHIVGWEDDPLQPTEAVLREIVELHGISDRVVFHGSRTVGAELNEMYRMADIYVIPSYHEGFPRTIWEAMANGLPVIASAVGAIPDVLENGRDALLIRPKQPSAIADAVRRLVADDSLRRRVIAAGLEHARENTLEVQTKKIVSIIRNAEAE